MTQRLMTIALTLTLWMGLTGVSAAAVSLTYVTESPDGSVIERVTLHVREQQLRFATQGGLSGASTSDFYLYDHNQQRLRFVQPALQMYHDLSPDMMARALDDLRNQRDQLQALRSQPSVAESPTQRQAIDQALAAVDQALQQAESVMDDGSLTQAALGGRMGELTLDEVPCTIYQARLFGNEIEVCFAAAEDLGLTVQEVEVMQAFQDLLARISGVANLYNLKPGHLPLAASYGRLGGVGDMTTLLRGVERRPMPRSQFAIPQHFQSTTDLRR